MNEKNDGGPAFPITGNVPDVYANGTEGMTLRDWFAGQALLIGAIDSSKGNEPVDHEHVAKCAYQMADAMLKAREK